MLASKPAAQDWQSYDAAADTHERIAVPHIFTPPARDLVAAMDLASAERILDIGTGTGIAARLAIESAPEAMVIALDPSFKMLRVARSRGLAHVVGGGVPTLPFAGGSFDRITASFVISHVPDYGCALGDMVRVLHPGGKLGVTAWGPHKNEHREFWQSLAEARVGKERIEAAVEEALRWEDWLTDAVHLRQALEGAGLVRIEVRHKVYTAGITIADFLAMRETSIQARFLQTVLDAREWKQFKQEVAAEFHRRFKDPIEHTRDVHIAIGVRA